MLKRCILAEDRKLLSLIHILCKSYNGRTVVDHLNLTVPQGCVYGFLGPNLSLIHI